MNSTVSSDATMNTRSGESRLRHDLRVVPDGRRGRVMVIDEIAGAFFRIRQAAWAKIEGGESSDALRFARDQGLVQSRHPHRPRSRFNPLAIQIPLVHTAALAKGTGRLTVAMWTRTAIQLACILYGVLFLVVLGDAPRLFETLSRSAGATSQVGAVSILVILLTTKLLHEWGHAVACDRVGASPRTAGIMLFFGMPCPYCDVTDCWRIRSPSSRAGVMLAGIYVECWISIVAAMLWLASENPWVSQHAACVMILCGVTTWMFNANPLMRYDGYYVLSDWVGSTDLRRDARRGYLSWLEKPKSMWREHSKPGRFAWPVYYLASNLYRGLLLISILTMLVIAAGNITLGRMALLIAMPPLGILVWNHFRTMIRRLISSRRSLRRSGIIGLLMTSSVIGLLFVPLPIGGQALGWIQADPRETIYAETSGIVERPPRLFQPVHANEIVAKLRDDDLLWRQTSLAARAAVNREQFSLASERAIVENGAADSLDALRRRMESDQERMTEMRKQVDGLNIRCRHDGWLLPTSLRNLNLPELEKQSFGETGPTSVSEGMPISAGTPLAMISGPDQCRVAFRVDHRDRMQIQNGTRVWFADAEGMVHQAAVTEIAPESTVSGHSQQGRFLVTCRLPPSWIETASVQTKQWWRSLGSPIRVRYDRPRESVLTWAWSQLTGQPDLGSFR